MKKKALMLLVSSVATCLSSCVEPVVAEKETVVFSDKVYTKGELSIGLGETKYLPSLYLFSWEICSNEPELLTSEALLRFETNVQMSDYFEWNIVINDETKSGLLRADSTDVIAFKCTKPFEGNVKITEGIIETKNYVYKYDLDLSFSYNADYIEYPPFAPSYSVWDYYPGILNWNIKTIFFYKYIALNFEWFYKLKSNSIKIKNISFSDNLNEFIDGLSFLIIDKRISWNVGTYQMMQHDSFEDNGYSFESLRSIDYTAECSEDKGLIYKIGFKKDRRETNYTWVCGDVIYDFELNGVEYTIKDEFYF